MQIHELNTFTGPVGDDAYLAIDNGTDTSKLNAKLYMMKDCVTPEMFGAKGDGVSDDTSAFLSSFSGAYKNICIPQGNYLITGKITIPDGTTVLCNGTIKKSGAFDVLFEVGNNCNIQLNIDLDKASATDYTSSDSADIYINGKQNVCIHDTKILNTDSRYAVWIEKSSHITIQNCYVNTYVETGIGCRDGNFDIKILNNSVINGHGVQPNRYPICLNSSAGASLTISRNIVCDGNYIEDYTSQWEGIDAHDLKDSVITNNTIVNTVAGIVLTRADKQTENIIIANNVFRNTIQADLVAATYGIVCCVVGGSKNITIANNILSGCGNNIGTTDVGGINVYGVENLKISNNTIDVLRGTGINIMSLTNLQTNEFVIDNNKIDGGDTGIAIANVAGISVVGEIYDNIIKNSTLGLSGMTKDGTGFDSCVFAKNNKFVNCTTDFTNVTKGLLVSPSGITSSGFGRQGMEIEFTSPQDGITKAVCSSSASGSTPATWQTIHRFFPICGEYELSGGYANVWDTRITANSYAVVTNFYKSASSPEQFISAVLPNAGRFVVYVRNKDGTNATGTVKLALLVIQQSS